MKVGSLFSGYGGLDLAVEAHFGAETAWQVEVDPHASKVLVARFPGVPNLGDITQIDWAQVELVDILCGGFPCQDISSAGLGAGIKEGTRSGLWFRYADAVRVLRPRYVVIENVGALLRRGLDIVLGDLAALGYDAEWTCLRAADVGAPHRRERVFLVAHPHDVAGGTQGEAEPGDGTATVGRRGATLSRRRGDDAPDADGRGFGRIEEQHGQAPPRLDREHRRHADRRGVEDARSARGRPGEGGFSAAAADTGGERHGGGQDGRGVGRVDREDAGGPRERERPRQVAGDRSATADCHTPGGGLTHGDPTEAGPREVLPRLRDADVPQAVQRPTRGPDPVPDTGQLFTELREHEGRRDEGRPPLAGSPAQGRGVRGLRDDEGAARPPRRPGPHEQRPIEPADALRVLSPASALAGGSTGTDGVSWGPYGPAIHRWELILGRPAPQPTDEKGRLSPWFVEFLMGLPEGWVCDHLDRRPALRALGNGVVPQQALAALRLLDALGVGSKAAA